MDSKEKSFHQISGFSPNLDIDEVTKTLPNKGRRITIVTPSTATIPRKLVLFPSTTTTVRTENTDTAFQTDNYNNRNLPTVQRRTQITDKYNTLDTSSLVSSLPTLPSSSKRDEYELEGETSTYFNSSKPRKTFKCSTANK